MTETSIYYRKQIPNLGSPARLTKVGSSPKYINLRIVTGFSVSETTVNSEVKNFDREFSLKSLC